MKAWMVLGLLLSLTRPIFAWQLPGCPNTRASDVPVHVDDSGASSTCQLGVMLFGVSIGINVVRCPHQVFFYPAHQACLGASSLGTQCGDGPPVPVRVQKCACGVLGTSALGISLPVCNCHDAGTAGMIGTGKTLLCVVN